MKKKLTFICQSLYILLFLGFCSLNSHAETFQIQMASAPTFNGGPVSAIVTSANMDDPTPNFCYQKKDCYYAGFIGDGVSFDVVKETLRSTAASKAATMGELVMQLSNRQSLYIRLTAGGVSSLGSKQGYFCMYPAKSSVSGTFALKIEGAPPASNCVIVPPAPVKCTATPDTVFFEWEAEVGSEYPVKSNKLYINCTDVADVRVSVQRGLVPLNGSDNQRAEINFAGQGWGGVGRFRINGPTGIPMTARLVGLSDFIGVYKGSSIIFVEIN